MSAIDPAVERVKGWLAELRHEADHPDEGDGWAITDKGRAAREVARQRHTDLTAILSRIQVLEEALEDARKLSKTMVNAHKLVGPRKYQDMPQSSRAFADGAYTYGKDLRKIVQRAARQALGDA